MKLYWLDLETTSLIPTDGAILEVAVSEADLSSPFDARPIYHAVLQATPNPYPGSNAAQRLASGKVVVLDPFVFAMHSKNGLLAECAESPLRVGDVEEELLALVPAVADREEQPTLAGSSVHFDHSFLRASMPELAGRFSHRHYDVSAVKLFCRSLGMSRLPRAAAHRAREDVLESIAHARLCAEWAGAAPRRESTPAGFLCLWCVRPFGGGVAEMSAHEKACDWRPGGPLRDERGVIRALQKVPG